MVVGSKEKTTANLHRLNLLEAVTLQRKREKQKKRTVIRFTIKGINNSPSPFAGVEIPKRPKN
jgi:hypothetical protein